MLIWYDISFKQMLGIQLEIQKPQKPQIHIENKRQRCSQRVTSQTIIVSFGLQQLCSGSLPVSLAMYISSTTKHLEFCSGTSKETWQVWKLSNRKKERNKRTSHPWHIGLQDVSVAATSIMNPKTGLWSSVIWSMCMDVYGCVWHDHLSNAGMRPLQIQALRQSSIDTIT